MTKMIDEHLARLRTHRDNIDRYRRLLETTLTELEREFIERRLQEEQSAFQGLAAGTFPFTLDMPIPPPQQPTAHEAA